MTSPRARTPQPSGNVDQDIQTLFREFQAKRGRIFKTVPNIIDLDEGEVVFHDDEAATHRLYVKLNGVLRFCALT
jgi:hypothetical protein